MELPKMRHGACQKDRCSVCLEDCQALTDYLLERTGLQRQFHDMLREYRTWLERNGIPAESKYGWPLPAVYASANVEAFIRHAIGEEEDAIAGQAGGDGG